ncbi:trypco2 family protein [Streptomyces sp. NPDC048479]|uniref:trypco2 family protein n=1 Tax=Streptomyces sp. NPDC048479 TaxID=3154725 RepID=UPI00342EF290
MSEAPLWAELGETISAVRGQLQQAVHEGQGEGKLKFRTGPVELEFSVEVRKEGNAKTRILVLPWSAEAGGALSAGTVHRLKLILQPIDDSGEDLPLHGSC